MYIQTFVVSFTVVKYQVVFDSTRNNSRIFGYNKSNNLIKFTTFTGKRRIYVNRRACENTTIYIQVIIFIFYNSNSNERVKRKSEKNLEKNIKDKDKLRF